MLYDLANEEEAKKYLNNVEIEYKFNCYHEKDGAGCYRLAEFLLNVRKEYQKSAALFKQSCDEYKYGHACFRYGNNKILGKGCTKDMSQAMEYHKKGCDLGHWSSCHNVGLFNMNGEGDGKVDVHSALKHFKMACDNDDADSCHRISALYIQGHDGLDKNMDEAFKYGRKSCDLGCMYACANVSQMYRKGEGVAQDTNMAKKYRRQADNMYNELKKTRETSIFDR